MQYRATPVVLSSLALSLMFASGPVAGQAQDGPIHIRGPLYAIGNPQVRGPDEAVIFLASGTLVRRGELARLTEVTFRIVPKRIGPVQVARFDATIEIDCAARTWRMNDMAVRDDLNRVVSIQPGGGDAFRPIDSQDAAKNAELAFACSGQRPSGQPLLLIIDAERAVRRYRASKGVR